MTDNIPDFTEIELHVLALLAVQADHEAQRAGRN
jgi:hypothetical protein